MQHTNSVPLHAYYSNPPQPSPTTTTLMNGSGPAVTSNAPYHQHQHRQSLSLKRDLLHESTTGPASSGNVNAANARPVKRSRKAINCEPCRASKLKCDRGKPCSGCVLRGTTSACYPDSLGQSSNPNGGDDPNDPNGDDYLPNPRVDPRAELTRIRNSLIVLEQAIARSAANGIGNDAHGLRGGARLLGGGGIHSNARLHDDPPPKPNEGGVFIGATSIASTLLSLKLRDRNEEDDDDSGNEFEGGANDRGRLGPRRESSSDSLPDYYDHHQQQHQYPSSSSSSRPPLHTHDSHLTTRSSNPFNEPSSLPPPIPARAHIDDLLQSLPDPADIDMLIDNYFHTSTWLHRHVHEATFRAAWARFKASTGEDPEFGSGGGEAGLAILLATVFVILAISLQYLVPTHPIFERLSPDGAAYIAAACSPDSNNSNNSNSDNPTSSSASSSKSPFTSAQLQLQSQTHVQVAIGAHFFGLAELAYERHLVETKALSMTLVEYLLLKVHYLNIRKEDCEQIWEVRGMLVSLGTAMGLHRDPGKWKMSVGEVERRRWAWWNILQTDRWQAFLFGRPIGIANHHFDTQFPMEEPNPTTNPSDSTNPLAQITVQQNPSLAFLQFFRLVHVMGDIMDDVTSIRPVSHDRIMQHDRALDQLIRTLPPDMDAEDVYVAKALAPNQSTDAKRVAAQTIVHKSALLHVRFTLHRPYVTPKSTASIPAAAREMSLDIATKAASRLINDMVQVVPDYCKTTSLGVPGHLSWGSFHTFAAAMFFVFQLIWDREQQQQQGSSHEPLAGAGIFRENIRRVQRSYEGIRMQIVLAEKAYNVLEALKPLWEDPEEMEGVVMVGGANLVRMDEKRKMEVWANARKLAFPCHDSPLQPTKAPLGGAVVVQSSPSPPASGIAAVMGSGMVRRASPLGVGGGAIGYGGQVHAYAPAATVVDTISPYATTHHPPGPMHGHPPPPSYAAANQQHQPPRFSSNMPQSMTIAPPPLNHQAPSGQTFTGSGGMPTSAGYIQSPTVGGGYFDMGLGMGMGMGVGFASTTSGEDPLWSAGLGLYSSGSASASETPQMTQGTLVGAGESWASMYKFGRD